IQTGNPSYPHTGKDDVRSFSLLYPDPQPTPIYPGEPIQRRSRRSGPVTPRLLSDPTRLVGEVFALCYRAAPGYEAHLWPHATLALSGDVGDYWLNSAVVGDHPEAEKALRHAASVFRDRALPGWMLHPDTLAPRLAPIAGEFGLSDAGTVPFMTFR